MLVRRGSFICTTDWSYLFILDFNEENIIKGMILKISSFLNIYYRSRPRLRITVMAIDIQCQI